jgi:hypothetical protein
MFETVELSDSVVWAVDSCGARLRDLPPFPGSSQLAITDGMRRPVSSGIR